MYEFLHHVNSGVLHSIKVVSGWASGLFIIATYLLGIVNTVEPIVKKAKVWFKLRKR